MVRKTYPVILLCLTLAVVTLAVYWQVGSHKFILFDDDVYITNNQHVANGITAKNIVWAFASADTNWHPVTWLSHMADAQLYGLTPRGHHLANAIIHTISSVLLFLLLLRITGACWQSMFVAALFALHPMHVESVAWVAERKDVLSAFFCFLTLLIYSEYVKTHKPSFYILSIVFFVLGLMSKPMLVTLPIVMLLVDFWPLDRYRLEGKEQGSYQLTGRLIVEKIPFFACSLFSGVITIFAQRKGEAIKNLAEIPFMLRIENALVAYVKYIIKTLCPYDLALLYPFPQSIPFWQVTGALFVLLLLSLTAIRIGRQHPYFAVGWFWFLIMLVPVIGIIQVGRQSMADRYSYLPAIGLFIMVAWGVSAIIKKLPVRNEIVALLAGSIVLASAALTWQQLGYWRDSVTLFRHTIKVTKDNIAIHNNLGMYYLSVAGNLDSAIKEFQEVLRIKPDDVDAHINLGLVYFNRGDLDSATKEFQEVLRIKPEDIDALINLGLVYYSRGDLDPAINEFRRVLRISPDNVDGHIKLGVAYAKKAELDLAIQEFRAALRLSPDNQAAQKTSGGHCPTRAPKKKPLSSSLQFINKKSHNRRCGF